MPDGETEWIEGQWEARKWDLWRKATSSPLGQQFWSIVNLDPNMNPELLTEEQVGRLANELDRVERLNPEVFIPYHRQEWLRQYRVTKPERWADVPVGFEPRPEAEAGYRGAYFHTGEIALTGKGISPATIAHEMAHKQFFSDLSPAMQSEVGKILGWLERTSPEFRRTMQTSGPKEWGKKPWERHAVLYAKLGREPEKIPFYLDRYYEGLKPWKITEGLGARRVMLRQGYLTPTEFYTYPWETKEASPIQERQTGMRDYFNSAFQNYLKRRRVMSQSTALELGRQ